jgi:hypothetical protein
MLMIAAEYEDGNDADALRRDPMFKLALDRLPTGVELCSQSTISRLENLPDRRALPIPSQVGGFALRSDVVQPITVRAAAAFVEPVCSAAAAAPAARLLRGSAAPPPVPADGARILGGGAREKPRNNPMRCRKRITTRHPDGVRATHS